MKVQRHALWRASADSSSCTGLAARKQQLKLSGHFIKWEQRPRKVVPIEALSFAFPNADVSLVNLTQCRGNGLLPAVLPDFHISATL